MLFANPIDTQLIAQIIDRQVEQNFFEGNVLIADQGQIVYHHSSGHVDEEQTIPIQTNTPFSIASITKMFTAIVILQLVEEKQLRLDGTLADYLPDLAIPNASEISIHHLLLHISGLPQEKDRQYLKSRSPQQMLKGALRRKGKINAPGQFRYSNTDYLLLGQVIEKVSGQSYESAIRQRILEPLGLKQTGFAINDI